jgi:O-antigen ligase
MTAVTGPVTLRVRASRIPALPIFVLLVVVLAGRYSPGRAGIGGVAIPDLRVLGVITAIALAAIGLTRRPAPTAARRPEGWLIAATLLFLYQVASALWAPEQARTGEKTLDVALLAVLTGAFYLLARRDPAQAIRWTFGFFLAAALLFAAGALLVSGPGAQGRYAAFGGGPNIFVRIEILGIISAIALHRFTGRLVPLLAIAPLAAMAVLSGSRGGLVAGAVVALGALVRARGRIPARPAAVILGALAVVGALVTVAAPAAVAALRIRFVEQTIQQGYSSGRTEIWRSAARLATAHPLFGSGLDGYYGLAGRTQGVEYPHDYVLAIAAEGGLAGLVLLGTAILLWIGTVRRPGLPAETSMAVAAAVFVGLDTLFSGDNYDARLAWVFAALAAAAAVHPPATAAVRAAVTRRARVASEP